MPTLKVSRVGNRHISPLHPVLVDMAESPVLVALGLQFRHFFKAGVMFRSQFLVDINADKPHF